MATHPDSIDRDRRALAVLLAERSYIQGEFVLTSGRRSSVYFDCRLTTCHAEAMPLIARACLAELRRAGSWPRCVGGMTAGADPIAAAIAYGSLAEGPAIDAFSVRKERKSHGTGKWIEGCAESPVVVVEDVVTSGGSVIRAIARCREEGLEIAHVVALVDREEGGMAAVEAAAGGAPVTALFTRSELDALREGEGGGSAG